MARTEFELRFKFWPQGLDSWLSRKRGLICAEDQVPSSQCESRGLQVPLFGPSSDPGPGLCQAAKPVKTTRQGQLSSVSSKLWSGFMPSTAKPTPFTR